MSRVKLPAVRRLLLPGAMAVSALAGAGLRWAARDFPDKPATSGARTAAGAAEAAAPAPLSKEALQALPGAERLTALLLRLPALTAAEILPLVEQVVEDQRRTPGDPFATDDTRNALLLALFTRWSELDPPGMIAALDGPPFSFAFSARQLAVQAWAARQPVPALTAVGRKWPAIASMVAMELLEARPDKIETLLPWLLLTDDPFFVDPLTSLPPDRYLQLAVALKNARHTVWAASSLARENFPRALELIKALPAGPLREAALRPLLEELAQSSHDFPLPGGVSFRSEYEALPPGPLRDRMAGEYAAALMGDGNPDAALAWARELSAGPVRSRALARIARGLPEGTAPETVLKLHAEAWMAHLPGHRSGADYLVPTDVSDEISATFGLRASFHTWHSADPAAALAWLQTISDRELRTEAVMDVLIKDGADLALLPSAEDRLAYATAMLPFREAGTDPYGYPSAASKNPLPPDVEHMAALKIITRNGVPEAAWAAASAEDRRFLSAQAVGQRAEHPEKALEFFNAMAPEERSLGAWHEAGNAYIKKDAAEASQWMQSLPPGPERDAAAAAMVEHLTAPGPDQDGRAAFAWAENMDGEMERTRYVAQALRVLPPQDANGVRGAVEAMDLPQAEKDALLRQLLEGGAR